MRIGCLAVVTAVLAVASGGCGDGSAKSAGPVATQAGSVDSSTYVASVRAGWKRFQAVVPQARDDFNGARDVAEARQGLAAFEQAFGDLARDLDAAGPPPARLVRRHERFLRLTRSMGATYTRLRAGAHGSRAEAQPAVDAGMAQIAKIGPGWAKAGDALLNAL
jgi:hypothetical protein